MIGRLLELHANMMFPIHSASVGNEAALNVMKARRVRSRASLMKMMMVMTVMKVKVKVMMKKMIEAKT